MSDDPNLLYDNFPFPELHPDRLCTIGTLFGMTPAPATACRVLELGCGQGGNLTSLAMVLPESQFLGIDLSEKAIALGQADVATLGLQNIELRACNILDLPEDVGLFDYILVHGVYSWVPREVQQAIFKILRKHLAPQGIGYVSYNALPGWHARGMLRELLLEHVPKDAPALERIASARRLLSFLSNYVLTGKNTAGAYLKRELDLVNGLSDLYLYHEHLVDHNEALYFKEFTRRASEEDLQYLGESDFYMMMPDRFGPEAAQALESISHDLIEFEQYMDCLCTRFFRRTLLCHKEVELQRSLSGRRLHEMWVRSRLRPESSAPDVASHAREMFKGTHGDPIAVTDPLLKLALFRLASRPVAGLRFLSLFSDEPDERSEAHLGSAILRLYGLDHVQLGIWRRPFTDQPGPKPLTSPLVRLQADRGQTWVTNLENDMVPIDRFDACMLRRMDGEHTHEQILSGIVEDLHAGRVQISQNGVAIEDRQVIGELMWNKLPTLIGSCLLMA